MPPRPPSPALARREAAKRQRHDLLLEHERALWAEGLVVAGLDEAGAGPLAGPVTAACVVLDPSQLDALIGVNDSKTLTPEQREVFAERIRTATRAHAVADASVEEIDRLNIRQAGLLAMWRALEAVLPQVPELGHLLVDAREVPRTALPQTSLIKGDARSLSIAAASILAKVERDRQMVEAGARFPGYGFERHKGYGTAEHVEAIQRLGVTPLHRTTFAPVSTMLRQPPLL
jgi:ribonuclease HII